MYAAILAVGLCAVAALVFFIIYRSPPAFLLCLACTAIVVCFVLMVAFPMLRLAMHQGRQVAMRSNVELHQILLTITAASLLLIPASLCWLFFSVVPKNRIRKLGDRLPQLD